MDPEIAAALRDGVMTARLSPAKARALNAYAFRGRVERVLPGVYGSPGSAESLEGRLRAVRAYGDDIVVVRASAAALTFWEDIPRDEDSLDLACPRPIRPGYGLDLEQRLIRPELLTRSCGVLCTVPALTVLDLIPEMGPEIIQEALRRRACSMKQLRRALALTPRRRGNLLRRDLLSQAREEPWSHLELRAHEALRDAGMVGWRANLRVRAGGRYHFVDVGFREEKVALELDGYRFHSSPDAFHRDRARDLALMRAGWIIAHFTEQSLPSLVETTRALLARRPA